jgi:hypothetical protein
MWLCQSIMVGALRGGEYQRCSGNPEHAVIFRPCRQ